MQCPVCHSDQIQREDDVIFDGVKEQVTADYFCGECGCHFRWRKGEKGLEIVFDPKKENTPELEEEEI